MEMTSLYADLAEGSLIVLSALMGAAICHFRHVIKARETALQTARSPAPLMWVLAIEGTEKVSHLPPSFASYGINATSIRDVTRVAGPCSLANVPPSARECLQMCCSQGMVRGVDTTLLAAGGALEKGQSLFFVLTETALHTPLLLAVVAPA